MRERRLAVLVVIGGCLAYVALAVASLRTKSATYDEGAHLPAGYTYLRLRDYRLNPEHPPLIKELAAAPLLFLKDVGLRTDDEAWAARRQWEFGRRFLYRWNDADRLLFRGRLPMVGLGALLCVAVFAWTRRLWGLPAAVLALVLCVFNPDVLAHGQLVTTDLAVALFIFLTVVFFESLTERVTPPRVLATGFAAGAALATKFSAVVLAPILMTLAVVVVLSPPSLRYRDREVEGAGRRALLLAGVLAVIAALALVLVWAAYSFTATLSPDPQVAEAFEWQRLEPDTPLLREAAAFARRWQVLPDPYLFGLLRAFHHSEGRRAFLLGQVSEQGWWYYFPVTFALKTPIALIFLVALSLATRGALTSPGEGENPASRWRAHIATARTEAFLWAPVVVYLLLTQTRGLNIGHRHLLPIYPFLFVVAGRCAVWARAARPRQVVVAAFAAWSIGAALWIHPHYLAYFNELLGGPSRGYRLLVDSNLDWGQDLKTLRAYADGKGIERLKLSYFGSADPRYYGFTELLPGNRLAPEDAVVTTVRPGDLLAVSATNLQGIYVVPEAVSLMETLRAREPMDQVGYSILIYRADFSWSPP